ARREWQSDPQQNRRLDPGVLAGFATIFQCAELYGWQRRRHEHASANGPAGKHRLPVPTNRSYGKCGWSFSDLYRDTSADAARKPRGDPTHLRAGDFARRWVFVKRHYRRSLHDQDYSEGRFFRLSSAWRVDPIAEYE